MHPLRKLRESGKPTSAQVSELLAENIVFNSPLQEITTRLPGRIDLGVTSFTSVTDLISALRRAEAAHGEHEKRTGVRDENWADWYAAYMAAEQAGTELPI